LYKTHNTMAGALQAPGLLLDLTEYLENDPEMSISDFLPSTIQPFTTNGKHFALPYAIVVNSLRANITLLGEAGLVHPNSLSLNEWTWDRLTEYGRKLTRVASDGQVEWLGIATTPDQFDSMVHQAGGYFF